MMYSSEIMINWRRLWLTDGQNSSPGPPSKSMTNVSLTLLGMHVNIDDKINTGQLSDTIKYDYS